jgi:hypothetical protein
VIPRRLVTHRVVIARPDTGTNAAGDTSIPTGTYTPRHKGTLPCIAEQVSGDVAPEQARTPRRNTWRVTVDECVDVEQLDQVTLTRRGAVDVVAVVVEVLHYPVPRRVAHIELTCRESTG